MPRPAAGQNSKPGVRQSKSRFVGRLGLLMVAAFVETLGNFLILALLPFYAERYGASPLEIGVLISAFAVAQTLTAPFWGRFSDRAGRRPVILLGLLMATVAYVMFAFADSLWLLFLSRLAQGIAGGTVPVVFAYTSDVLEPEHRAEGLGWITSATSLAAMLGPAIGSLAAQFADEGPGLVVAVISAVTFMMLWRYLPEPERSQQAVGSREAASPAGGTEAISLAQTVASVITHPLRLVNGLIWVYATGMLAMTGLTAIVALYLSRRFGVTEDNIWIFFAYLGGASIVMRLLVLGPAVRRFGELRLLRIGAVMLAFSMLLLPLPGTLPLLALTVLLVPVATAFLFPCTTALITRQVQGGSGIGQLLGVQQGFGGLSRIFAPLLAGWLFEFVSVSSPFWVLGGVLLVVSVVSSRLKEGA
jgi:multidrug resistance protein